MQQNRTVSSFRFGFICCLLSYPISASFLVDAAPETTNEKRQLPSLQALRLTVGDVPKVELDGLLTEEAWQWADPATGFRQREPHEGRAATEKTEVRVLFDTNTLYIGVLAYDTHSRNIIARTLQRDKIMQKTFDGKPQFAGDDGVAILLDPFHDHRNAVVFATNPRGAEFEALLTEEGREFNIDWRAVWQVAAKRIPEGWSAEFAIPFRTLRYPSNSGDEPWGFNIYRIIRHKNEETLWSAWSRDNEGFARVSRAGHLYGMQDLPRPSFNLEVKPFALTGINREFEQEAELDTDRRLDLGFDAKWEIRPGMLLDVTVNTDFAQVEIDDERVNLTRFDLFFPEKRDFFLENAGIFEFGLRGFFEPPPFLLFFSRRIGISDDTEVPVMGGLRLSGRIGNQTIGFLNTVTDYSFGEPRTNFAVARVKRDIGSSNYVGAMVTDRRTSQSSNTGIGVDWSFWPTGKLNVQGFVAGTFTSGAGGDDHAYRLAMDYGSNHFGFTAQHLTIGPEATADMGFITRTNIRRTDGFLRLTTRPKVLGLRTVTFFLNGLYLTTLDLDLRDWNTGLGISPEWHSGESFVFFYSENFTRLDEGFDLTDEILVPEGDYREWQLGLFANTSRNRSVVFNTQNLYQRFFDGTLLSLNGSLDLAFNSNLSLSLGYTHNHVAVPDGAFNADLASMRVSYAFSTRLVAKALLQYNGLDDRVSTNVRLNYIHRPGSDLFIVYTEEHGSENSIWDLKNRGLVLKLTYLQRF